jgi:acyl-CoA thioester hydrolase
MSTVFWSESPSDGDYAIELQWPVGWGDLDSFGHVNNAVYFRYFEHARIHYFQEIGMLDQMEASGIGPILARTDCRFRRAVSFPDSLSLSTRVATLGSDRFSMHYRLRSEQQNDVVAYGSGDIVMFDYRNNCKAPLPDTLRAKITKLEGYAAKKEL